MGQASRWGDEFHSPHTRVQFMNFTFAKRADQQEVEQKFVGDFGANNVWIYPNFSAYIVVITS